MISDGNPDLHKRIKSTRNRKYVEKCKLDLLRTTAHSGIYNRERSREVRTTAPGQEDIRGYCYRALTLDGP